MGQAWERIGVTGNHPIWSEDRHDYVAAMDLRVGERLKNLSGDTVWVQQKLPRPGPTPVYNLEVQDEHVYYVGANGVLAHNVGKGKRKHCPTDFEDHHIISDKNKWTKDHERLRLSGFNLQSNTNKIFLPKDANLHISRSIHKGKHRNSVSKNLAGLMDAVVEEGKAKGFTSDQYLAGLRQIIANERKLLRSGRRALNRNNRPGSF